MIRYVLAFSENQFRNWCSSNGVSPVDKSVIYISGPETLMGVHLESKDQVIYYGSYHLHPQAFEIYQRLKIALLNAT